MKPRYLVAADYPDSLFPTGSILEQDFEEPDDWVVQGAGLTSPCLQSHPSNYPEIFKPLEWWEERDVSEIEAVKFLKVISFDTRAVKQLPIGSFQQVDKWLFDHETKRYQVWVIGHAPIWFAHNFQPTTLEEFTNYQNKQNERI